MKPILAIDPGPTESAYVIWDGHLMNHGHVGNWEMRRLIQVEYRLACDLAIEMVACYGMPVGRETFETCLWIGRFHELARREPRLVYRKDIKLHLCQSMRAKDSNVMQALKDRFGGSAAVGTKKKPGPLYGISNHKWAAIAVAIYAADNPI